MNSVTNAFEKKLENYLLHHKPTDSHVARKRFIMTEAKIEAKKLEEKELKEEKPRMYLVGIFRAVISITNRYFKQGTLSSKQWNTVINFVNFNMIPKGFLHKLPDNTQVDAWHFKRNFVWRIEQAYKLPHSDMTTKELFKIAHEMWELQEAKNFTDNLTATNPSVVVPIQ